MASTAPIEIWIKIFEDVIDVPEFFCPDPLTTCGTYSWSKFRLEGYYWRAERWRNALRRVHSSWNTILNRSTYQHRFVRISDVTHRRLQEETIPWNMTLKIAFGREPGCTCAKYCDIGTSNLAMWRVVGASLEVLNRIVAKYRERQEGDTTWRLRILDKVQRSPVLPHLLRALSEIADLTTINVQIGWKTLELHSHALQCLQISPGISTIADLTTNSLSLPRLTTLIIDSRLNTLCLDKLHAPALRHLQITSRDTGYCQVGLDELIAILEAVGKNLHTFYYDYVYLDGVLPSHFWRLVPSLLQIRINCVWTHPPPRDHPVKTIQIHGYDLESNTINAAFPSYPLSFRSMPGWPLWSVSSITLIGIEHAASAAEWDGRRLNIRTTDIWERIFYYSSYRERCLVVAEEYAALGWTFTDYTGWGFGDFLVYLIEARRDAMKSGIRNWNPPGYAQRVLDWGMETLGIPRRRDGDSDREILAAEMSSFEYF